MRIRSVTRHGEESTELQMTPMIDVVFLLLIFFVTTFKIVSPEGAFNIRMPRAAFKEGPVRPEALPPVKITLRADQGGRLTGILFGKGPARDFLDLRKKIRATVDDAGGPGSPGAKTIEVELACDYQLRYEYVMDAITAVSGFIDPSTGVPIPLVEKVRFSPPQIPGVASGGE